MCLFAWRVRAATCRANARACNGAACANFKRYSQTYAYSLVYAYTAANVNSRVFFPAYLYRIANQNPSADGFAPLELFDGFSNTVAYCDAVRFQTACLAHSHNGSANGRSVYPDERGHRLEH